jgi:hypothetical protein
VHHSIVPTTARLQLDAAALRIDAMALPDGLSTFAPADMVLHSAVHLFNDGEFPRALRDLHDITLVLHHFTADAGFASRLADRAAALDLVRPALYALRYSHLLLGGPLAEDCLAAQPGVPSWPVRWLMDRLFLPVLTPPHPDCRGVSAAIAESLLYVRSHYLRMPWHLLVPHLIRKAYRRLATEPPMVQEPVVRDRT